MANRFGDKYKEFYIAVGQPGAYSQSMPFLKNNVIALGADYHILIKHAPLSIMPKIKNVVSQSWKDEDGDDVWLPCTQGANGLEPAITHEAVEYNPTFLIYSPSLDPNSDELAKLSVLNLIKAIQGRWLKIFDEYTGIGYDGVYLLDGDDDPKFKRRNYEYLEFTLKFKVNGATLDSIFSDLIE